MFYIERIWKCFKLANAHTWTHTFEIYAVRNGLNTRVYSFNEKRSSTFNFYYSILYIQKWSEYHLCRYIFASNRGYLYWIIRIVLIVRVASFFEIPYLFYFPADGIYLNWSDLCELAYSSYVIVWNWKIS